jgi:hypothetical protein
MTSPSPLSTAQSHLNDSERSQTNDPNGRKFRTFSNYRTVSSTGMGVSFFGPSFGDPDGIAQHNPRVEVPGRIVEVDVVSKYHVLLKSQRDNLPQIVVVIDPALFAVNCGSLSSHA